MGTADRNHIHIWITVHHHLKLFSTHRGLSLGGKIPWRKEWQSGPLLLPGKFHGQSLAGYNPWGCKELDAAE